MANLVQSQVPASALPAANGTLEALFVWSFFALWSMNSNDKVVENETEGPTRVVQYNVGTDAAGRQRLIMRVNIELEPDYITNDDEPLWNQVKELASGDIAAAYLA